MGENNDRGAGWMIDIDLEQEINSYLDELMGRSDEYRKQGDEKLANELLRIITELSEKIGLL
jgi:hypothetical protein